MIFTNSSQILDLNVKFLKDNAFVLMTDFLQHPQRLSISIEGSISTFVQYICAKGVYLDIIVWLQFLVPRTQNKQWIQKVMNITKYN